MLYYKKIINLKNYNKKIFQTFCFGILSFFILLNYALLKTLKDGFIIKAIGAESVGFIKLFLVLPSTFGFVLSYTYLSNKIFQHKLFNLFATIFLINFTFLFFYILPNSNRLTISSEYTEYLIDLYPRVKWFIKIFSFWQYSLLFLLSELWGGIIYTVFFWQLANRVSSEEDAKFVYPFMAISGNSALIISDVLIKNYITSDFQIIFSIIIITNIFTILTYNLLNIIFKKKISLHQTKKLLNLSLKESIKFIFTHKYLWLMFFSLAFLGIILNMVEIFSKANLSKLYVSREDYILCLSKIQFYQAIISATFSLLGSMIVRNVKWNILNLITPYTIVITSAFFFFLIAFGKFFEEYFIQYFQFFYLEVAIFLGVFQIILSRSFRHSFFDPSREMLYIKFKDPEVQTKGKASIDILGGKLGKSGVGIIETLLFTFFPWYNLDNAVIIFTIVFFFLAIFWLKITNILSREYKKL